jgi:hypothetical protein
MSIPDSCPKNRKTITIDGWESEEEAAGGYNVLNMIFNGPDNDEWNEVPVSMETFNRVIDHLHRDGWNCSDEEMSWLKNAMTVRFGLE